MLSMEQKNKFMQYCKRYDCFREDPVLKGFFSSEDHIRNFLFALEGNKSCQNKLEYLFRNHLFSVRFVKFISSTIKLNTFSIFRNYRRYRKRHPLLIDHPKKLIDRYNGTYPVQDVNEVIDNALPRLEQFQNSLNSPLLLKAYNNLSHKQQLIIYLYYALCLRDKEIAGILNVSQQSISKLRNTSLQKMRFGIRVQAVKSLEGDE